MTSSVIREEEKFSKKFFTLCLSKSIAVLMMDGVSVEKSLSDGNLTVDVLVGGIITHGTVLSSLSMVKEFAFEKDENAPKFNFVCLCFDFGTVEIYRSTSSRFPFISFHLIPARFVSCSFVLNFFSCRQYAFTNLSYNVRGFL